MSRPERRTRRRGLPGVEVRGDLGVNDTLLSIDKARRLLGYEPRHSWRDEVTDAAASVRPS